MADERATNEVVDFGWTAEDDARAEMFDNMDEPATGHAFGFFGAAFEGVAHAPFVVVVEEDVTGEDFEEFDIVFEAA